ncbi:MAG: hypothetical protein AAF741_06950 [Bacteroidota bacterium]
MLAHNLLDAALLSLDKADWQQLHQWLNSPLHHSHAPSLELFHWMADYFSAHHELPPTDLQPPSWAQKGLSRLQFRKYRSLLLESVENFLAWKVWRSREEQRANDLLEAYRLRGCSQNLAKRLKRDRKRFKQYELWNSDHLSAGYVREELGLIVDNITERRNTTTFEAAEQRLLRWQTAERMRKAVATLARSQTSGIPIEMPLFDAYLNQIESSPELLEEPAISLYYHACRLYRPDHTNNKTDHFSALTQLLPKCLPGFTPTEQTALLKLTINFMIRRINTDPNTEILQTALDLYQLGLDKKLLLEEGHLSVFTFNNFVSIALKLHLSHTVETFIDQNAHLLSPQRKSETLAFNRARLLYAQGKPDQALLQLQSIDYQDPLDLLNARMLQIRIYYEAGEDQALYDLLRATRALLRRRQIGYHQENFRNNLRMVQKLLRLEWHSKKAVEKFRQQVIEMKPLSEKEWLLGRL